jgi:hypothetical protein
MITVYSTYNPVLDYYSMEKRGKVDRVVANQSLLLGGYTVSLPTFPLLGVAACG